MTDRDLAILINARLDQFQRALARGHHAEAQRLVRAIDSLIDNLKFNQGVSQTGEPIYIRTGLNLNLEGSL